MIDDQELCSLFKMESEEHLQNLSEGLLRLETNPQDGAILEEVFRAAHSLKGAARMLGVVDVESIAHHFEDALGAARRGRTILTSETVDRLYGGLDAIRALVHEAVTGEAAGVSVERVLAGLNGTVAELDDSEVVSPPPNVATAMHLPIVEEPTAEEPTIDLPAVEAAEHSSAEVALPNPQAAFKIETIRVQPQKLDGLMTLAADLTVTTTRVARGLAACEEISELWEEWNKDVATNSHGNSGLVSGAARKSDEFYDREQARLERLKTLLGRLKRTASEDVPRLNFAANDLEESIRKIRLLPLSTIFDLFPRLVRDLAREQGKEVQLVIEGETTTADKRILEELKDPLMHIIRNAIDHGIELPDERERNGKPRVATLKLLAYQTANRVVVEIIDDGQGLDEEAIKRTALKRRVANESELEAMTPEQLWMLIFAPGFSTSTLVTDISGRGVGLDVVRANVEGLHGIVEVESLPAKGCVFRLQMPLTLATTRVLLVEVGKRPYALPVEFLLGSRLVSPKDIFSLEGRDTVRLDDRPISVARLGDFLELGLPPVDVRSGRTETPMPCILIELGDERLGLFVDDLLDEQEVILQPLGPLLQRVRNVAGSTILGTGDVCMILNPHDLMKSMQKLKTTVVPKVAAAAIRKQVILLAEDSITTRTQEKRIIESAGYEVVTAVDGADAFDKLSSREFDGVVTDVEMPNLDGLGLAAKIRENEKYKDLPIILVTSLASEADRRRGMDVGANAYITKGTFEQKVLVDTIRRLV